MRKCILITYPHFWGYKGGNVITCRAFYRQQGSPLIVGTSSLLVDCYACGNLCCGLVGKGSDCREME